MNKDYYFIPNEFPKEYIKITCESETFAIDVFLFLHPSGYRSIQQEKPFGKKLLERISQRQTNN